MASKEMSINFGFKKTQKIKKPIRQSNKKGNTRPRNERNHHWAGLRLGTKQANKNSSATIMLMLAINTLVMRRNILAIVVIYDSSLLAFSKISFSSALRCSYPFCDILSSISSTRSCVSLGFFTEGGIPFLL